MDKYIIIVYDNYIYKIEKEPYETDENTYRRGWFIIKNLDKDNYDETVLKSIIYLNENKNKMKYLS
jgi:hypothetical protein